MKRSMLALALLAVAGTSWGQTTPHLGSNFRGAVSTFISGSRAFPGGFEAGSLSFLAGNTTRGFAFYRNAFSGFAVLSTQNTPLDFLGTSAEQSFSAFYAGLLPLYQAIDGPAMQFAALGTPVTEQLTGAIVLFSATAVRFVNDTPLPPLPGLE